MNAAGSFVIDWPVFVGVTLILFGFAAYATGRALAITWRPARWAVFYTALLGLFDRFIHYALFDGDLLSLPGYLIDTAALILIALAAFRMTQAAKMVQQYPWLYRRSGLFSWREIANAGAGED
jgi:hypothetical protein